MSKSTSLCSAIWLDPLARYFQNHSYTQPPGEEYREGSTTAVENIIWRLRRKLEDDPKRPVYIKTVIRCRCKIKRAASFLQGQQIV